MTDNHTGFTGAESNPPDDHPTTHNLADTLSNIRPGSGSHLEDPELWNQIVQTFQLLRRIEQLVEQPQPTSPEAGEHTAHEPAAEPEPSESVPVEDPFNMGGRTVTLSAEMLSDLAYLQQESTPESQASAPEPEHSAPQEPKIERQLEPEPAPQTSYTQQQEDTSRWWVSFSGDLSLERLSRLRIIVNDSPFTIEARFDEISDGLIVLRIVTDGNVTMNQMQWIIEQVMDSVGIDHDAAILSRN